MTTKKKTTAKTAKPKKPTKAEETQEMFESIGKFMDRLGIELGRTASAIAASTRFQAVQEDGTYPIFYRDHVVNLALPWANVDHMQMRILEEMRPPDLTLLSQVIDIISSLKGRTLVDVGSFTGCHAMFLRAFLKPSATHLIEPQNVMQDALKRTIKANNGKSKTSPVHLHQEIIDEDGKEMMINLVSPNKLAHTAYLSREGADLRARSIDSFKFGKVGLLILDYPNDKIHALRGAVKTIEKHRPVVLIDSSSRDVLEYREFMTERNYSMSHFGRAMSAFLPN